MTRLNWLRERWKAASVAKKCIAAAGAAILGMALLGALVLLGTPLTRQQVGFAFLGVMVISIVTIVAIAIFEIESHPRQNIFPRHPAGRPDTTQAQWNAARDKELL